MAYIPQMVVIDPTCTSTLLPPSSILTTSVYHPRKPPADCSNTIGSQVNPAIWSRIEPRMGIVSACLLVIGPPLRAN